jgi:hypothetical protein
MNGSDGHSNETTPEVVQSDLRPFGYDVILQLGCKHGKEANHRLELIDTGELTFDEMLGTIDRIFDVHARDLEIMRLDLAVDVPAIPVRFFQEHTRIKYKRWMQNFGIIPTSVMGMRGIQTLTFGKRPNLIRIYDKVAEYREQYRKLLRRFSPGAEPPTFEQCFGIPSEGFVLTRVERQMGGARIPSQLSTVRELKNCIKIDPFDAIDLIAGAEPEPDPRNSFMELCTGLYLQHLALRDGMQTLNAFINRHSKRNRKWVIDKFAEFLPKRHELGFTRDTLLQLYRESATKQFSSRELRLEVF